MYHHRFVRIRQSLPFLALLGCAAREVKAPPKESAPPITQMEEKTLSVGLTLKDTSLQISVRDNGAPARTDLWLYTLEDGQLKPFTAFKDPDSKRKSRRLMLPATIAGQPSQLVPADTGNENGFMSDGVREKRQNGALTSAIDGDVVVTLESIPTSPVVVVAGLEDQRYAGAAGLDTSGASITLPAGIGAPEKHTVRSFETDIKPILKECIECHGPKGEAEELRLVTYDDVVNFDLAFAEGREKCVKKHAGDEALRTTCVNALTDVEYLVEPGAPALSPIARRTRPDEERGASPAGLKWFGKDGKRFGGHGDRRMPPQNTTEATTDDLNEPTYFDTHPAKFQVLFDWIAQGAKR